VIDREVDFNIVKGHMKVLITDGDTQHAIAVVRSLGRRGIEVTSASHRGFMALSFYSKYCSKRIRYPSPSNKSEFIEFMVNTVKNEHYDVLLPLRSMTIPVISEYKEKFLPYTAVPVADYESMKIASDKKESLKLAQKLNVPVPQTIFPKDIKEIQDKAGSFTYPVVVKASFGAGSRGVWYINSAEELVNLFKRKKFDDTPMIQEYIPGEGYGFFALFNHGEPRAIFMHHRLREYPITGGPSVLCESIYDDKLKELGLRVLKALNWHGVAMVEFKHDKRDNLYKLMEINPKFWGSLPLAIVSGVDFPYLTCKMAVEGDIEPVFSYKIGVKFRWLFPLDVLHLMAKPSSIGRFMGDFLDKSIKYSFALDDPLPNLLEPMLIFGHLVINRGRIKYPQGKPRFV